MKMLTITAISAIAATLICGCGQKPADDEPRNFVVGFDAEFPPYSYRFGTEYRGFDIDLARAVCAKKGWTFVPNPVNWDTKDADLNSGTIDCIWGGFTIQGRENDYTFSSPYIANSQVMLVRANAQINSLADLADTTVGVQTDTPVQKALSEGGEKAALGATFRQLKIEADYNQLVSELKIGTVDAVALDIGMARKKIADLPDRFKMLDEVIMKETYGIGFKKGNTALRDEVEAALREIAAEGTMKALAEKYELSLDDIIFK